MPLVLVDTNLLLLLVVGRTDRTLIHAHKRTSDYTSHDLENLEALIGLYDGVATTPHVLTETSNLLRNIAGPALDRIQHSFRTFVLNSVELPLASAEGCHHEQYLNLGLTDAVILVACEAARSGDGIELLTADEPLYNQALSLGLPAELY